MSDTKALRELVEAGIALRDDVVQHADHDDDVLAWDVTHEAYLKREALLATPTPAIQTDTGSQWIQAQKPVVIATPAPAAPEVDLVKKWRAYVKRTITAAENGMDVDESHVPATRQCADELAAWLPAHDSKVRREALEEAAQMVEREWFTSLFDKSAVAKAIRALAEKEQP